MAAVQLMTILPHCRAVHSTCSGQGMRCCSRVWPRIFCCGAVSSTHVDSASLRALGTAFWWAALLLASMHGVQRVASEKVATSSVSDSALSQGDELMLCHLLHDKP